MLPIHHWRKLDNIDRFIILWWCRLCYIKREYLLPDPVPAIEVPHQRLPLVKVTPEHLMVRTEWVHLFPIGS